MVLFDRSKGLNSSGYAYVAIPEASFTRGNGAAPMKTENNLNKSNTKQKKIALFGHFGTLNFGNEGTLQAILYHLRRLLPKAEFACICSNPEAAATTHNITGVPIYPLILKRWTPNNPATRMLRKLFIAIPGEVYRWLSSFNTLRETDMFIVPGTGLATDAYGLRGWGPYNLFKWSAMAKLRRCKVLFISVGAGPIYHPLGRFLVKSALSLADFRSYRDVASMNYLKNIGFPTNSDRVYPDLVFSLPQAMIPDHGKQGKRPVVGLGLMEDAGQYGTEIPSGRGSRPYLDNLVGFVKWLLDRKYDIRLLVGDQGDTEVTRQFQCLLRTRLGAYDEERIIDQPALSVEQLLPQIAATDIVVATRFHNVLMALLLNKPVISISFHHKCASLMSQMGLAEYCNDINCLDAGRLIEQFQDVERNAEQLKPVIRQKVEQFRKALDEQYSLIFKSV